MTIVFQTPGSLEIAQIKSFGTSVKSEGAIGFFGTGLKYALAILVRTGHQVVIHTDGKTYKIGKRAQTIRGASFDFLTINGRKMDYTTQVGKTWELWKAFRELESNTRDEGGVTFHSSGNPEPKDGFTRISVTGEDFHQVYANRHEVFLSTMAESAGPGLEVHPGESKFLYYRGIKVFELDRPSKRTYNITAPVELTEDRTLKNPWAVIYLIRRELFTKEAFPVRTQVELLTAGDTYEENSWDCSYLADEMPPGLVQELYLIARKRDQRLPLALRRAIFSIGRQRGMAGEEDADLTRLDQGRLRRASQFLQGLGFPVDKYPVRVVTSMDDSILGLAENGTVFLNYRVFMMGTKMVTSTLLEEFLHLEHGFEDNTRSFQNFLFDTIITIGEQVTGEPL